jgi:hypothetical protein
MAGQQYLETAPGKPAVASASRRSRTTAATRDWSRRAYRRACIQLVRHQRLDVRLLPSAASPPTTDAILSRAQRAHSRLSWAKRLARNARTETSGQVAIMLFGIPADFATSLGFAAA